MFRIIDQKNIIGSHQRRSKPIYNYTQLPDFGKLFSAFKSKTLAMPDCPRCSQPVDIFAIACPHCQTPLKAYGHPGIPLHRASGGEFLCTSCLYHEDDTCNFPQRPLAKNCTLYHDRCQPILSPSNPYISGGWPQIVKNWCQRHIFWLFLLSFVILSLLLSL